MEKKYSIEIDPRILELLGPNLYTNIYCNYSAPPQHKIVNGTR